MGRMKVDIKKIENSTRSQITYSKRRNGLLKKVQELSILSDIDIAVVTFSPSGRLTQFPNRTRLSDVLNRYSNLPANMIYYAIDDPQPLLQQLDHIHDDSTKTIFVNNQIKRYENQILISKMELQILEAQLRCFERNHLTQATTLAEVRWQEAYLMDILKQLSNRKEILLHRKSKILERPSNIQIGTERNVVNSKNLEGLLNPYRSHGNPSGSSIKEAMGFPVHYNYHQDINSVLLSPMVPNFPSLNQFMGSHSQFQPIQKGMANYGIAPPISNQQLKNIAAKSSTEMVVGGDVPLAVGQQPRWTSGAHTKQNLDGQEDDASSPLFDPEEVKWLTSAILNDDQNLMNVTESLISPRASSPSIYNPTGHNLHVDPFLRVYNLNCNNNNNNNNSSNDVNTSSTSIRQNLEYMLNDQEDPWAEYQASLAPSGLSIAQMQNEEELRFSLQESLPSNLPKDLLQFDDLRIEDITWDEILKVPRNQEEGTTSNQELAIPDVTINLEDLGIFAE